MDELIAQGMVVARAMWRRRWVGLLAAWVVALVGAVVLMRMPDRYEATARVYVNTKSVLKPLLRDLAVEPDIDQTLQMLARTMITRPNVESLMQKTKFVGPSTPQAERELVIDHLMREIKLTSVGRDNVFTFSYRDTSPTRARVLVESLVSLFVESDLGAKSRDVDAARGFIDEQIKAYEGRLAEAEDRLKQFKLRNLGMADASGKDYFSRISALTDELAKLNLDLRATEQSRDALRRELSGERVTLVPDVPLDLMPATPELDARIEAQRKQLDELLRRYTDLHPDVVSTRRVIARLEEQRQQEVETKRRAEAKRPPAVSEATNTVLHQTRLALAEAEASVAALRVRVSDSQSRLAQMRASATRVPQVEAELAQLNRDYDVVRRNYEALVGQRERAQMSEDVGATRLASFRVIDPPRTGEKPVFPNRLVLGPLVLVLALVAGVAASFVAVQLLPTVDSARALQQITARPVLGSISMLTTSNGLRLSRRYAYVFAFGLSALVVTYSTWCSWVLLKANT